MRLHYSLETAFVSWALAPKLNPSSSTLTKQYFFISIILPLRVTDTILHHPEFIAIRIAIDCLDKTNSRNLHRQSSNRRFSYLLFRIVALFLPVRVMNNDCYSVSSQKQSPVWNLPRNRQIHDASSFSFPIHVNLPPFHSSITASPPILQARSHLEPY